VTRIRSSAALSGSALSLSHAVCPSLLFFFARLIGMTNLACYRQHYYRQQTERRTVQKHSKSI